MRVEFSEINKREELLLNKISFYLQRHFKLYYVVIRYLIEFLYTVIVISLTITAFVLVVPINGHNSLIKC